MKIQHNSPTRITKVEDNYSYCLRGCMCFGEEGHNYSLSENVYQYVIDVDTDNILNIPSIWLYHEPSEVPRILDEMCRDLDIDRATACNLLDETEAILDDAEKSWLVQQFQGKIAHALGYDCAKSFDEQGAVYIAYCVNKKMEERQNG